MGLKSNHLGAWLGMATLLSSFCAAPLFAFHSKQTQTVAAGVFVGGPINTGATQIKIHHDPLTATSLVTRQIIIIGEAGYETPVPPPPFSARLTPSSDFGPLHDRKIRVTVKYRFVSDDQLKGLVPAPDATTLPVVEGPDPTSFAFQIPSSSFTVEHPILQYRIIAERLAYSNGQLSVIASTTAPPTTSFNPEPWTEVHAAANDTAPFDAQGGRLTLHDANPLDGESSIDIPAGAFNGPTQVTLDEVPAGSAQITNPYPNGVRYYEATSDKPLNGTAQVTLLYPDFEFPIGSNGIVDGTNISVNTLTVFVWDGFSWRRLGGVVDTNTNTIRAKIPFFGLFSIAPATPLSPEGRRPEEKIITPNGDGVNDVAAFSVDNLTEDYKIDIYDITGHRVKTIHTGSSLTWDGRDESGKIVESGVYIYQYEVDGKRVSGFIAVAK
jgi:gliding motility-associated-like protein